MGQYASCDCRFRPDATALDLLRHGEWGDFTWGLRSMESGLWPHLAIVLPYTSEWDCGSLHRLTCYRAGQTKPANPGWLWDGDRERPTLTPSIRSMTIRTGGPEHETWHGYLTAGRLVSV